MFNDALRGLLRNLVRGSVLKWGHSYMPIRSIYMYKYEHAWLSKWASVINKTFGEHEDGDAGSWHTDAPPIWVFVFAKAFVCKACMYGFAERTVDGALFFPFAAHNRQGWLHLKEWKVLCVGIYAAVSPFFLPQFCVHSTTKTSLNTRKRP